MKILKNIFYVTLSVIIIAFTLNISIAAQYKLDSGQKISLSDYKGQWLIVNYWAGWCPTCVNELPALIEAQKNPNINVLGVHWGDLSKSELLELKDKYKLNYPLLLDDPKAELNIQKLSFIPVNVFINPQGQVVKTITGKVSLEQIKNITNS